MIGSWPPTVDIPISAVIAGHRIVCEFEGPERALMHGHTYCGHPVACAAALENLRIIEAENLVERARDMEAETTTSSH